MHTPQRHAAGPLVSAPTKQIKTARIDSLIRDDRFQARQGLDPGTVKRYATIYREDPDKLPPIKIALINKAGFVIDGWHRVAALEANKSVYVRAEVIAATEAEAFAMASTANLAHGKPLRTKELRKAFALFVKGGQHRKGKSGFKSYRELAKDLGVSHMTVYRWMKRDFPQIARYMDAPDKPARVDAPPAPGKATYEHAERTLLAALSASHAVTDEADRATLLMYAEQLVEALKGPPRPGLETLEDSDF
jgi:hypothetical protein